MFKVGDRVMTSECGPGVISKIEPDGLHAVKLDSGSPSHPNGTWFIPERNLTLIGSEMNKLTPEQAEALLSQDLNSIKEFIKSNTSPPPKPKVVKPAYANMVGCTSENLEEAARLIQDGPSWDSLIEGYGYWKTVHSRLLELSREMKKYENSLK